MVVAAGFLQGVFAVPMKYARHWRYENIWLAFTFMGLLVLPWILTFATVPQILSVYRITPLGSLVAIAGFGLCWGIGSALTGLGLNMLGIGLGVAIILGISSAAGSLIPLIVLAPGQIHTHQGHVFILGTLIMLLGIACGARAGYLRERGQQATGYKEPGRNASFVSGLLVVIAAGLLSSALNLCYAFSSGAVIAAQSLNVPPIWTPNVVTALAMSGGFIANLGYCSYLLKKNATAQLFWPKEARLNWGYSAVMAICWFGGQALYGIGMSRMGHLGAIVGWPLLMGMIIVVSSLAGVLTGEWNVTTLKTRSYMVSGMALVATAIIILAHGQNATR